MQRDAKIGKISQDMFMQQKVEILGALRKLGEKASNIMYINYIYQEPMKKKKLKKSQSWSVQLPRI